MSTEHPNDYGFPDKNDEACSALKWILQTGSDEYELDDDCEKILDIAASVLIDTYKDKSILPVVDNMIFKRIKKGRNFHDLVWAFFRIRDAEALRLIAAHLLSPDPDEAEFARRLLNLEAFIGKEDNNPKKQYESYLSWLEENSPFLDFTGECYQFTSKPVMYKVNMQAKSETEGQR